MIQFKKRQQGFSLVEMAIVLVILSVLIGGGFSTMGAYLDNAKQSHTLGSLENTKKAMLNYVKVNYYMPCPDINNDGVEDRDSGGLACSSTVGTVPFNSIGLGAAIVSDDYGNVFAYGVDTGVMTAASMTNKGLSASYFSNTVNSNGDFPAFRLETPPTSTNTDVATSYTVCKKSATVCDATPNNVEVNSIPAIIVAFNQNGGATALSGCNAETGNEAENCNNDLFVWKKFFSDGAYDDQLVTISGYEIKEQVLELLNNISLTTNDSAYDGYDYIVNKDLTSTNDYNTGTTAAGVAAGADGVFDDVKNDVYGDSLYVTGSLQSNINMSLGSNKLLVKGDVEATANGGNDHDYFSIVGKIGGTGTLSTEQGNDTVYVNGGIEYRGSVNLGKDNDFATIGGSVNGALDAGTGDDVVFIESDVTGTGSIIMGDGDDILVLYKDLIGGSVLGGAGTADQLYIVLDETSWVAEYNKNADATKQWADVYNATTGFNGFETVVFSVDPTTVNKYHYDYNPPN